MVADDSGRPRVKPSGAGEAEELVSSMRVDSHCPNAALIRVRGGQTTSIAAGNPSRGLQVPPTLDSGLHSRLIRKVLQQGEEARWRSEESAAEFVQRLNERLKDGQSNQRFEAVQMKQLLRMQLRVTTGGHAK